MTEDNEIEIVKVAELVDSIETATSSKAHDKAMGESRLTEKLAKITQELDAYKAREKELKLAEMTEKDRLKQQLDEALSALESTKSEALRNKIAAEYSLPSALAARLIGSDEDSMRADAESLASFLPKPTVGSNTNPSRAVARPVSIDDQIAEAERNGDFATTIALKAQKLSSMRA